MFRSVIRQVQVIGLCGELSAERVYLFEYGEDSCVYAKAPHFFGFLPQKFPDGAVAEALAFCSL